MKTLIIGYPNEQGTGPATVICGPEVPPAKQIEVFDNAKTHHQYPSGILRVEFCTFEAVTIAIKIDDETSAAGKQRLESSMALALEKAAQKKADKETAAILQVAELRFKSAVKSRNELIGKQAQLKIGLRNAQLANDKKAADKATSDLEAINAQVESAKNAVGKAESAFNELKNPAAETEKQ